MVAARRGAAARPGRRPFRPHEGAPRRAARHRRRRAVDLSRLPACAFWFLRHGETDWNLAGRSQGRVDIPLNETGRNQAASAAQLLRNRGIATIVSSPLSRARDTAQAVADVLKLPVQVMDDLQEVAFGVHEGSVMGAEWFTNWVDNGVTPDGGESFADLRTRAAGALTRALALAPPVLVVAHGALFRAVRTEMGLSRDIRTPNAVPMFCQPGDPWVLTPAG